MPLVNSNVKTAVSVFRVDGSVMEKLTVLIILMRQKENVSHCGVNECLHNIVYLVRFCFI